MVYLREIPGHPNYYAGSDGSIWSTKRGSQRRMRTFIRDRSGHLGVNLTRGGVYRMHSVHRLVALAWIGEPPTSGHVVMHADDDPENNAWWNLAYGLPRENSAHMVARARQATGERHGRSRLTIALVSEIRSRVSNGEPQRIVADDLGLSCSSINDVVRRRTWREVA